MPTIELLERIQKSLSLVIDPETEIDVLRMRLVQNLIADEMGRIKYTFRPSSPLCPLAVPLALSIAEAIANVEGVYGQDIKVTDYIQAEQLTELLNTYINGYLSSEEKVT